MGADQAFFLAFSMVKDEAWPKSSGMPCTDVVCPMGILRECDMCICGIVIVIYIYGIVQYSIYKRYMYISITLIYTIMTKN